MRIPIVLLATAVLIVTALVFHGHGNSFSLASTSGPGTTPTPAGEGTSSPSPSPKPTSIAGKGPIVVWTSQLPTGDVGFYGLDLAKLDGGTQPVLLGTTTILGGALGPPIGQATPALSLPVMVNTTGVNRLLLVSRQGVRVLDPDVGFPQSPSIVVQDSSGGSLAVLINGDNGLVLHIQDLRTEAAREIPVRLPSNVQGDSLSPQLVAWYDHGKRFLVRFLNGGVSEAPMFSLDLNGRMTAMPWLDDQGVAAGGMLTNETSFVYRQGAQLRVADVVRRSFRTIVRLQDTGLPTAIVSPDGSRVAYASALRIKVGRLADGQVLMDGFFDPSPNLTPLVWIDNNRLIALAESADLVTGQITQALLLLDTRSAQGTPPTAFFAPITTGGADLNFVGVLR